MGTKMRKCQKLYIKHAERKIGTNLNVDTLQLQQCLSHSGPLVGLGFEEENRIEQSRDGKQMGKLTKIT